MGVSLSAAVRERNLVPRSAAAFLGAVEDDNGDADADADASGIVAATFGSLASSAALEGVKLDGDAGSNALGDGVAGDDVGAVWSAEVATRGSFCDLAEAGEEGERVAHAGSTVAVSVLPARAALVDEVMLEGNGGEECKDELEVEGWEDDCDCAFDDEAGVNRTEDVVSHLDALGGDMRGVLDAFEERIDVIVELEADLRAAASFRNRKAVHLDAGG